MANKKKPRKQKPTFRYQLDNSPENNTAGKLIAEAKKKGLHTSALSTMIVTEYLNKL